MPVLVLADEADPEVPAETEADKALDKDETDQPAESGRSAGFQ